MATEHYTLREDFKQLETLLKNINKPDRLDTEVITQLQGYLAMAETEDPNEETSWQKVQDLLYNFIDEAHEGAFNEDPKRIPINDKVAESFFKRHDINNIFKLN